MDRPEVAVGAVVVHRGQLLLVRRSRPPGAGRWSLPGGRVEGGETLISAVQREVREETGLRVRVGGLCGIAERMDENHHFVILDFWAEASGGDPVAADDASAAGWFPADGVVGAPLVDGLREWLAAHDVLARLR